MKIIICVLGFAGSLVLAGCKKGPSGAKCEGPPVITAANLTSNQNTGGFCAVVNAYNTYEYKCSFASATGDEVPTTKWEIPEGAEIVLQEALFMQVRFGTKPGKICVTLTTKCGESDKICKEVTIVKDEHVYYQTTEFPGGKGGNRVTMTINGKAYVGLGRNYGTSGGFYLHNWYSFNELTEEWTKLKDFPDKSVESIGYSATIGSKGYVAFADGSFWEYNSIGDNWTQKEDIGFTNITGMTLLAIGNKIYHICGKINGSDPTNQVLEYDPAFNQWTRKEDFPGLARYSCGAFAHQNRGYIIDGYTSGGCDELSSMGRVDDYVYDPALDLWQPTISNLSMSSGYTLGQDVYVISSGVSKFDLANQSVSAPYSNIGCGLAGLGGDCITSYVAAGRRIFSIDEYDGLKQPVPFVRAFAVKF